ncbi:OsmC family protein [Catellatospora sp. NPDC049609]|uniref:OsmC family protein n=1 Tax=Catellatospora sp. NPDC049609 TaxID=3155505 RepID=UPI00341ABD08
MGEHRYELTVEWTGDEGTGTGSYRGYRRTHEVHAPGRPTLPGSSDPAFRGEADRWNPEQLLLASLSQCHMLWYLHLCSVNGVVVTGYTDTPQATMVEDETGGHFTEAVLRPHITVADAGMTERALALHADANKACFIAASVNFPVRHEPVIVTPGQG